MRKKIWVGGFSKKDVKIQGGYEEMLMFADKVGGWVGSNKAKNMLT